MIKKKYKGLHKALDNYCEERMVNVLSMIYDLNDEMKEKILTVNTSLSLVKNKNYTKRPLSGYLLYCQDNRQIVKSKNPQMKSSEIFSELAKLWKTEDDNVKLEYNNRSKKLKAQGSPTVAEEHKIKLPKQFANNESDGDITEDELQMEIRSKYEATTKGTRSIKFSRANSFK